MKPGDEVFISAGIKGRYRCAIREISDTAVLTDILEKVQVAESHPLQITLAQAIPKGKKMDDIIRMACELGVNDIIPVITERCVTRLDDVMAEKKATRWQAISHAAAKQSRAPYPTTIHKPAGISSFANSANTDLRIVMWEGEVKTLKETLTIHPAPKSIMVLIGPEGGLTAMEVETLKSYGFETATFGAKILRTETAGVAAVSALLYHYS